MKRYLLLSFIFSSLVFGQLVTEDFNYTAGDNITDHGWTAHSSGGTNPIKVASAGLSYAGYTGSGVGNAAVLNNSGEDDNISFSAQTSGVIYYSFLVNVAAVSVTGSYFTHFYVNASNLYARVFAKNSSGNLQFGISNSNTVTYGSTNFAFNTTYLCIVKYSVSANGLCSLWVFSSGIPATEAAAGTPLSTFTTSTGLTASISALALRQTDASQNLRIDAIRVATSWAQVPLPVELRSFGAKSSYKGINLHWSTAIEKNNAGFDVERLNYGANRWQKIAFVKGNGNSNNIVEYKYFDELSKSGKYSYRLKQIDNDGSSEYMGEVSEEFTVNRFSLEQNYPNPFNPTTTISYTILTPGKVTLKIFNMSGKEITTLVDEYKEPGIYKINYNTGALPSGNYIYQIKTNKFTQSKKMILLK